MNRWKKLKITIFIANKKKEICHQKIDKKELQRLFGQSFSNNLIFIMKIIIFLKSIFSFKSIRSLVFE